MTAHMGGLASQVTPHHIRQAPLHYPLMCLMGAAIHRVKTDINYADAHGQMAQMRGEPPGKTAIVAACLVDATRSPASCIIAALKCNAFSTPGQPCFYETETCSHEAYHCLAYSRRFQGNAVSLQYVRASF